MVSALRAPVPFSQHSPPALCKRSCAREAAVLSCRWPPSPQALSPFPSELTGFPRNPKVLSYVATLSLMATGCHLLRWVPFTCIMCSKFPHAAARISGSHSSLWYSIGWTCHLCASIHLLMPPWVLSLRGITSPRGLCPKAADLRTTRMGRKQQTLAEGHEPETFSNDTGTWAQRWSCAGNSRRLCDTQPPPSRPASRLRFWGKRSKAPSLPHTLRSWGSLSPLQCQWCHRHTS